VSFIKKIGERVMKRVNTLIFIFMFLFCINQCIATTIYLVGDNYVVLKTMEVDLEKETKNSLTAKINGELKLNISEESWLEDITTTKTVFHINQEDAGPFIYAEEFGDRGIITVKTPDTEINFLECKTNNISHLKKSIKSVTKNEPLTQKLIFRKRVLSDDEILKNFMGKTLILNIVEPPKATFKVILDGKEMDSDITIPAEKSIRTLRFKILDKAGIKEAEYEKLILEGASDYEATILQLGLDKRQQPITINASYKQEMPKITPITKITHWRAFLEDFHEYEKTGTCQNREITTKMDELKLSIQNKLSESTGLALAQFKYQDQAKERLDHVIAPKTSETLKTFINGIISDVLVAHLLADCVKAKNISKKEISLNEILENNVNVAETLDSIQKKIQEKLDPLTNIWTSFLILFYDWSWKDPESKKYLGDSYEKYFDAKSEYFEKKIKLEESWKKFVTIFKNFFFTKDHLNREIASTSMEDLRIYLGKRIDLILKITSEIVGAADSEKDIIDFFNIFKPVSKDIILEKLEAKVKSAKLDTIPITNIIETSIYQNVLNPYLSKKERSGLYKEIKDKIPGDLKTEILAQIEPKFKSKIEVIESLGEFFAQKILNEYLSNKIQSWNIYESKNNYLRTIPSALRENFDNNPVYITDAELAKFLATVHYVFVPSIIYYSITQRAQSGLAEAGALQKHPEFLYENFTKVIQEYRSKYAKSELSDKPIVNPLPGQINIPDALKDLFGNLPPLPSHANGNLQTKLVKLRKDLLTLKSKLQQLHQKLETLGAHL
jgi:hypothetical protein